jgi:sortase (surface protein transpeptidase)
MSSGRALCSGCCFSPTETKLSRTSRLLLPLAQPLKWQLSLASVTAQPPQEQLKQQQQEEEQELHWQEQEQQQQEEEQQEEEEVVGFITAPTIMP